MREYLQQLCEPIWGKHWQTPLARHLKVNPRTVRYWCSGKRKPIASLLEAIQSIPQRLRNS